jgi:ABC-type multidrug transport system fused ATPase/permease subunit
MKSFQLVRKYMRKYAGVLVLTIISMLLLVGVQLLAPWLVKQMVSTVTMPDIARNDLQKITRLALFALSAYVLRSGLQFVRFFMWVV